MKRSELEVGKQVWLKKWREEGTVKAVEPWEYVGWDGGLRESLTGKGNGVLVTRRFHRFGSSGEWVEQDAVVPLIGIIPLEVHKVETEKKQQERAVARKWEDENLAINEKRLAELLSTLRQIGVSTDEAERPSGMGTEEPAYYYFRLSFLEEIITAAQAHTRGDLLEGRPS